MTATAMCYTLLAARCDPARAEEREWKPRRHYRRLDERYSNAWAAEVAEEEARAAEQALANRRREERLRAEREEAEAAARRAEEAARRKKAEAILAQQSRQPVPTTGLPFSIKISGQDYAPHAVWAVVGLAGLWLLRGLLGGQVGGIRRQAAGKWVYDRSLGGKKVWVPADGADGTGEPRATLSDAELERLAAIAAAAGGAAKAGGQATAAATTAVTPEWWSPAPRVPPATSLRLARQADADRLLARMEAARNRGEDFSIRDIQKLRELCQEGGVTVQPRTVGARDALFAAAVDAAVAGAQEPSAAGLDLGDTPAPRFLSSLAVDLGVAPDKAGTVVATAVAAAARARLLDALAGIKEDAVNSTANTAILTGEVTAVMSLVKLSGLVEALPVLVPGAREVALIAESLQKTFNVEERRRAFYLMGHLTPEAARLTAALLGFDPAAVVPQLESDMEAARRRSERPRSV